MVKIKGIYIDASCLVELFAGQRKRREVEKLFEEIVGEKYTGYISTLTLAESEKALIEGIIGGMKGNPNKDKILHNLNEAYRSFLVQFQNLHTTKNITIINLSKNDLGLARKLLIKDKFLDSIDSIHLSKCILKKYILATFDTKLKSCAKNQNIRLYF